jgi:predicted HTH domain antitoxin
LIETSTFFWQALHVNLELPEIEQTQFTPGELRLELACALYARGKISAVSGAHLAGLDLFSFQGALKERGIPRNYSLEDLHDDMLALKKLFPA